MELKAYYILYGIRAKSILNILQLLGMDKNTHENRLPRLFCLKWIFSRPIFKTAFYYLVLVCGEDTEYSDLVF